MRERLNYSDLPPEVLRGAALRVLALVDPGVIPDDQAVADVQRIGSIGALFSDAISRELAALGPSR